MVRGWVGIAGASGFLAVGADAAGRHAFAEPSRQIELISIGARYGVLHAVALLAVAGLVGSGQIGGGRRRLWLAAAGWCFAAGLLIFPPSLYGLAMGAPAGIGSLTPFGGLSFMAGWIALLGLALSPRRDG